jgi:hypothetical protein
MKKWLLTFIGGLTLIGFLIPLLIAQESTFLAQKLMLENDLRKRIHSALEKILEDHRYVLDVTVDLEFTPTVREEVTFRPSDSRAVELSEIKEEDTPITQNDEEGSRRSRVTGIPIPGFDFQIEEEEPVEEPVTEATTEASVRAPEQGSQIVSQTYADTKSSVPVIKKMEVSCILPEGSPPELIENVRQIIMVAAHFDRGRGDELSVMTASFKQRRDEQTAEAIILRSIAEKIDQLEQKQGESDAQVAEDWRAELEQWKDEEVRRQEEERSVWRAELDRLENDRLRRDIDEQRKTLLARDSVRMQQLTDELAQLRTALSSPQLSEEEQVVAEGEMAEKEKEKAELDSVIEEKLAMLEKAQEEMQSAGGGMSNIPIYLMSAISLLAVIALAAVIIFNGRSKPKYVMPPPWMMGPPPSKKKVKGNNGEKREPAPAPAAPPPQPAPQPVAEDTGVLQSEIKSSRQSIVSMAVGEPETATAIVKEWLEEEAPPPPEEPAQAAPAPEPAAAEEEDEGKKKKKKKKK